MAMITITMDGGRQRMVPAGTMLLRLAQEYQRAYENDILLAMVDHQLQELRGVVEKNCHIHFVTAREAYGMRAYERSLSLLLNRAVYDVIPVRQMGHLSTKFSVTTGLYVELTGDFVLNEELLRKIEDRMRELVKQDIPIEKTMISMQKAREMFHRLKMYDKEKLFRYRRSSWINLYAIDGFIDYYYGYMVPSTGYLKVFSLELYHEGLVLRMPSVKNPGAVAPFEPHEKIFRVMKDSDEWQEKMHLSTVGDINDRISRGQISEMVLITEAKQEREIANIAAEIAADPR